MATPKKSFNCKFLSLPPFDDNVFLPPVPPRSAPVLRPRRLPVSRIPHLTEVSLAGAFPPQLPLGSSFLSGPPPHEGTDGGVCTAAVQNRLRWAETRPPLRNC